MKCSTKHSTVSPPFERIPIDRFGWFANFYGLVVGSGFSSNKSAAIYNLEDDEWSNVDDSNFDRWATALVVLGKRIFAVGGGDSESIEEFIYESKS